MNEYKGFSNFNRLKSSKEEIQYTNTEISKEKWLRPGKNKPKVFTDSESSTFLDMLIDKCWSDQQLPLMSLDVDLNIMTDDGIELNLYPILRILENQRVRNQSEHFSDLDKQEVILLIIKKYL